jgi:uncharacterized protein (TIGR02118 family)
MVHLLFLIKRKPGLSKQAFSRHWREIHGPLAQRIPGFHRYVQSHTLETQGEDPPYDGVAEIWIADEGAGKEVFQTREYREGAFVDEPNFVELERVVRLRTKDHVVLAGSPIRKEEQLIKRLSFTKRKPGRAREEFFRYWREVHGPLGARLPSLRRYVQSHVLPSAYAKGDPPFDGAAQLWFEDLSAMQRATESKEYREEVRPDGAKFTAPASIVTLVAEENRVIWSDPV